MSDAAAASFVPDSALVDAVHPSPNINARRNGLTPSLLILHYTGLDSVERSIAVLADPVCQVSCHYVIDEDGHITQMVAEDMRAWHAGVSSWQGHTDINSMSIGIEIQNPGIGNGYPDFPDKQMARVVALAKDIVKRRGIRREHVLAHSDVAPLRKSDPGEKFDWRRLAAAGVGHWVEPSPIGDAVTEDCDGGGRVLKCQQLLVAYGYQCPQTGELDEETNKVVTAFQRHFRPRRVDGNVDASTLATLQALLAARSGGA